MNHIYKVVWSKVRGCYVVVAEIARSNGKTRSGTVNEVGYGMSGKVIDYDWDYAEVRQVVEAAAQYQGWQFKTVLMKGKASY